MQCKVLFTANPENKHKPRGKGEFNLRYCKDTKKSATLQTLLLTTVKSSGRSGCLSNWLILFFSFFLCRFRLGSRKASAAGSDVLRIYGLSWDDTTGIDELNSDATRDTPVYNLRGQRLVAPQKGINIVGGRKVVVK